MQTHKDPTSKAIFFLLSGNNFFKLKKYLCDDNDLAKKQQIAPVFCKNITPKNKSKNKIVFAQSILIMKNKYHKPA